MIFPLSKREFNGIINYLKDYNSPLPSINANIESCDSIDAFVHRKSTSAILYERSGTDSIHIIFDFSFCRVKITNYLIEIASSGYTPT